MKHQHKVETTLGVMLLISLTLASSTVIASTSSAEIAKSQVAPASPVSAVEPEKPIASLDAKKNIDSKPVAEAKQQIELNKEQAPAKTAAESSIAGNSRKARADEQGSPSALTSTKSSRHQQANSEGDATSKQQQQTQSQPQPQPQQAASAAEKISKPAASSLDKSKPTKSSGKKSSAYQPEHDGYSKIAERHGSTTDLFRKSHSSSSSSTDRKGYSSLFGIEKASGPLSGMLDFKDNGLARTLGASMRSMMKSKYSVPAYVASALLGAVALLAFYESPISPLPVPPLPEPPVGRFPPEMPVIPPNAQVPFKLHNQQQNNYQNQYQRSFIGQQQQSPSNVMFPNQQQQQQQRMSANIQSLLTPKLSAQRKSGADYGESSPRSLFSSSSPTSFANIGSQQKGQAVAAALIPAAQAKSSSGSGFFSFLGFGSGTGGSRSSASNKVAPSPSQVSSPSADTTNKLATSQSITPSSTNQLSNSHFVNKVRSMFKSSSSSSSSAAQGGLANGYDSYKRMSIVQSLAKDTAFLPSFLTSTRKSSPPVSSSSSSSSASAPSSASFVPNLKQQPQISERTGNQQQSAPSLSAIPNNQPAVSVASKQAPSSPQLSFSFMKAVDKVAHALIDNLSSGFHKHSSASPQTSASLTPSADITSSMTRSKSSDEQKSSQDSIVSNILASVANQPQQQAVVSPVPSQQSQPEPQDKTTSAASSRTSDDSLKQEPQANNGDKKQEQQQVITPNVRKTRSIGIDYPVEGYSQEYQRQQRVEYQPIQTLQQDQQQPSKAAQINHVIDLVANGYSHNKFLLDLMMNRVGLGHAVTYLEQLLAPTNTSHELNDRV